MKKHIVNVPSNVRFISEWEGYEIPEGKCIVDKKVCGCGYTEFCINNQDSLILCSPRISLLENKVEQNPHCYYFQGVILGARTTKALGLCSESQIQDYIFNLQKSHVFEYLQKCKTDGHPPKFMVTYDSLPKLLEIMDYFKLDLSSFKVVVDEFQLIFSDSRFKADIELDFISCLNHYCSNICFLSSTPMLEDYLIQMPEFKSLDYYEFNWGEHQIIKPNITKIKSDNLEQTIIEIIGLYKDGKGPTKKVGGVEYKSREAVFYVSNVSLITSVIKKLKLSPDEVNIICSKSDGSNKVKIRKCGKGFKIGTIPTKGKPHKMFTFCTSTAFCGVDFYSTNAKSYVFSDCNLNTMNIDVSLEIPQIIGRQRLPENVFRYDLVFYYQTCIKEFTQEEFEERIKKKNKYTSDLILNFELICKSGGNIDAQRQTIRDGIKVRNYSDDFCSVDRITGNPVYNNLVYLSELRAWELQNKIYDNDFSVLRVLDTIGEIQDGANFLDEIVSIPYFDLRMEKLVGYIKDHPEDVDKIPEKYKIYFDTFTLQELNDGSLRKDLLERRIGKLNKDKSKETLEIIEKVYMIFKEGQVYRNEDIRAFLSDIYSGYNLKAKATDIRLYFETSRARITNKTTGRQDEGYRLLKRKY